MPQDFDPSKNRSLKVRKLKDGDEGYSPDEPQFEIEFQRRAAPRKRVVSLVRVTARLEQALQDKAAMIAEWDERIQHLVDLKAELEAVV